MNNSPFDEAPDFSALIDAMGTPPPSESSYALPASGSSLLVLKPVHESRSRILFFDTETTGLTPGGGSLKNYIVSMHCIIDSGRKDFAERTFYMRPPGDFDYALCADAFAVNGFTEERVRTFPSQNEAHEELKSFLRLKVDPYDRSQKYRLCAYNAKFDEKFLRAHFEECADPYYGSWFLPRPLDPLQWLDLLDTIGINCGGPNRKLSTVCELFSIPLEAHDAVSDARALRELSYRIMDMFDCVGFGFRMNLGVKSNGE